MTQPRADHLALVFKAANAKAILANPTAAVPYPEPDKEAAKFFSQHGKNADYLKQLQTAYGKIIPEEELQKCIPQLAEGQALIVRELGYDFVTKPVSTLSKELQTKLSTLPLGEMATANRSDVDEVSSATKENLAKFKPIFLDHEGKRGYLFAHAPENMVNRRGVYICVKDELPEVISYAYDVALADPKRPILGVAIFLDPKKIAATELQVLRDKNVDLRNAKEIWAIVQGNGSVVFLPAADASKEPIEGQPRIAERIDYSKARLYNPMDFGMALRSINEHPALWTADNPDIASVGQAPLGPRPEKQVTLKQVWPTILSKWNTNNSGMLKPTLQGPDGLYRAVK